MGTTDRRVVSVVFADVADFTALSERLDAEDVARIQDGYFTMAEGVVAAHGGVVEKFVGDAVMATFGASNADDSDVEHAVQAGLALVHGTVELEDRLGLPAGTVAVRVGINTGEVVVTRAASTWRITGDAVNTAARLQAAARPGQVLLGPETAFGVAHAFHVEPAGELQLKGKAHPVPTFRVAGLRPERRRGLSMHGLRAPMLGRERELAWLTEVVGQALAGQGPGAVAVVAPPGVGKSRLLEELCASESENGNRSSWVRLGDETERGYQAVARLLEGAGLGGEALEALEARLATTLPTAAEARAAARLTARLLAAGTLDAEPVDLYTAWTAALDAVPAGLALWVIEDFHLAGPDLRAFVRYALDHAAPGRRMLLLSARPTAGLALGMADLSGISVLHLEPLKADATRLLVAELVGDTVVPGVHVDGIVDASGGNPLFVEELLRSWIQTGVLRAGPDGWVAAGTGTPRLPSTVHGIYQGQLDALAPPTRTVVERGSVPGTTFPSDALPALGVAEPGVELRMLTHDGLLVGPHEHPVSREAYTYRHALLRDTAYGSLSRGDRAELHVRFARWIEALGEGGPRGAAELIGTHLAQAVDVVPAMAAGLADGTTTAALARQAATRLEQAANEHMVSSPQRAAALLERALTLPWQEDAARAHRLLTLGEAERRSGRLEAAMSAFDAAGKDAGGEAAVLVPAALGYENALFASRLPRAVHGVRSVELLHEAEAALPQSAMAERSAVLSALGRALTYAGRSAEGRDALRQAVDLAQETSDATALVQALLARRAGQEEPRHLPDRLAADARITAVLDATTDPELTFEAARLRLIDVLEAGDMAAVDDAQAVATSLVESLGRPLYFWYPPLWRAMRSLLHGRYGAAVGQIEEFAAVAHRSHYRDADQVHAILRMRLDLDTGQPLRSLSTLQELARAYPARWSFGPALVLARAGELDAARRYLSVYTSEGFENVPADLSWSSTMAHLAEVAAAVGDRDAAGLIAERLTPWAGHLIVLGTGALCHGSASHFLGLCLRTTGDLERAHRQLHDAVVTHEAVGAPGFAAASRAELATVLDALGDPGVAHELRRHAARTGQDLGMTHLAALREDG